MKTKHVYLCENTTDGIFTGIYDAWASKYGHEFNQIQIGEPENLELFCEYIAVKPDGEKAEKVARSICSKISRPAYQLVCRSALSKDRNKADSIYRFLILGFAMGARVVDYLSNQHVNHVFSMDRNVTFEDLHYRGFLRFSELENGILFSRIRPANNIITLLADHFADRFTGENWLIYDEDRKLAAVHRAEYPWILTDGSTLDFEKLNNYSSQELFLQQLWQEFVDTIGIEERTNDKLRLSMLPNRYREFMREVPWKPSSGCRADKA